MSTGAHPLLPLLGMLLRDMPTVAELEPWIRTFTWHRRWPDATRMDRWRNARRYRRAVNRWRRRGGPGFGIRRMRITGETT